MFRFPINLMILLSLAIIFCCTCNKHGESYTIAKIAVLPISSINQDTLYKHIGEGLTYDLISWLSCQKELSVRSLGSVKNIDITGLKHSELRNKLDIEYLAEGKYEINNDSLMLDLELINFPEGNIIRTMNFIISIESLSRLPGIVAREIVSEMSIKPDRAINRKPSTDVSTDSDAYQLYLKAVAADLKNAGDWIKCITLLEQSVKKDSMFKPAWTYLGHSCLEYSGLVGGEEGFYYRAEESLVRALELNEESPDAIYYLASLYAKTGKSESSLKLFSGGSKMYPGYSPFFSGLGYINRYAGKMEGSIEAYRKSQILDSSLANLVSSQMQILKSQIYLGNYTAARLSFEEVCNNLNALGEKPDEKQLFYAGVIHMYMKDTLTAIQLFDSASVADPVSVWTKFGQSYKAALTGDGVELSDLIHSLESRGIVDGERRYRMVHFYTMAGNYTKALNHLKASINAGFFNYPYIISDPLTARLREVGEFRVVADEAAKRYKSFSVKQ
ncbi:MAG: hypothetical protein JW965_04185 [Bacteroidales bacterium]|nr:hypothetical protein [Bacteroidales bacterium]